MKDDNTLSLIEAISGRKPKELFTNYLIQLLEGQVLTRLSKIEVEEVPKEILNKLNRGIEELLRDVLESLLNEKED